MTSNTAELKQLSGKEFIKKIKAKSFVVGENNG